MAQQYPFMDKIRSRINELDDPEKTITWLAKEIGRAPRWFYDIEDFGKIPYQIIQDICRLLDFNFVEDYNQWRLKNNQSSLYVVNDPQEDYKREKQATVSVEKKITVSVQIEAPVTIMLERFGQFLNEIQEGAEKYGFEIK